jgi:hypothetical protein
MSKQYPGGIITKSPATPTGPYQTGAAPGIWTLDQQLQYQQQGIWPTAGLSPNYIEDVFSTWLYTPATSNVAINILNGIDLAGKGGAVWFKNRSVSQSHSLVDTVRGGTDLLTPNDTFAAYTASIISAFNSNGFTTGTSTFVTKAPDNYVSWTFRKQPKFFDIVTYTGTGSTQNIAHNLGSTPGCIIVKKTSGAASWVVYHRSLGDAAYINLNLNDPASTGQYSYFYGGPSSTTFTVGSASDINESGQTFVAYLYAHNAGGFGLTGTDNVVSCASYTGNGSANGPVINLGYEPQFVIIKQSSAGSNDWYMYDNMRGVATGGNDAQLSPNLTAVEQTSDDILSFTATGFQLTNIYSNTNGSGSTYIYIAIRRGPMKVPTVGTSVYSAAYGTSGSPSFIAGFPVDSALMTEPAVTASARFWSSRLQGAGRYLSPESTATEPSGQSNLTYDWMNGTWNSGLGSNYFSWNWRRAPSFFDVVCYTGTGSTTTITHNLGVTPELVITKSRSQALGWVVWTTSLTSTNYWIRLDDTMAQANSPVGYGGTFSASNYTIANTGPYNALNNSGSTYVAYLFATCAGVSKVGSYTGNGTTQTINCGFGAGGARFVLIKRTDATGDWYVYDTARGMTVLTDPYFLMNSAAAQTATLGSVTTVSTGFALNSTILAAINVNGGTYIFLAIA